MSTYNPSLVIHWCQFHKKKNMEHVCIRHHRGGNLKGRETDGEIYGNTPLEPDFQTQQLTCWICLYVHLEFCLNYNNGMMYGKPAIGTQCPPFKW